MGQILQTDRPTVQKSGSVLLAMTIEESGKVLAAPSVKTLPDRTVEMYIGDIGVGLTPHIKQ